MSQRKPYSILASKHLVLAVAIGMIAPVTLTLAPAALAAGGDNPLGSSYDPAGTAWGGPWTPSSTEQQVKDFIDHWVVQMKTSNALDNKFERYVLTPGVPSEVAALGFHAMDRHTQMYAIKRLYDHFLLTEPTMRAEIELLGGAEAQKRMDEVRGLLFTMIFMKDEWVADLADAGDDQIATPPDPVPPDTALDELLDDLRATVLPPMPDPPQGMPELTKPPRVTTSANTFFDQALAARDILWTGEEAAPDYAGTPDLGTPTSVPLPSLLYEGEVVPGSFVSDPDMGAPSTPGGVVPLYAGEAVPSLETSFHAPASAPDATPTLFYSGDAPASVSVTFPQETTYEAASPDLAFAPDGSSIPIFDPVPLAGPSPLPPAVDDLYQRLRNTIDSTTWNLCGTMGASTRCTDFIAIGQPGTLDINSDGTADVRAHLSTLVDPNFPTGFAVRLVFQPLVSNLNAHVWAIYEVPGTPVQMTTGFDGRAAGLAGFSQIDATVKDVALAAVRDVRVKTTMNFTTPKNPMTVTFSVREMRYDPLCATCPPQGENPMVGALTFDTSPNPFTNDMRFHWQDTQTSYDFVTTSNIRTRARLYLDYNDTDSGSRRSHFVDVDQIPTTMTLSIVRASTGSTALSYDGNAAVGRVFYEHRAWADGQGAPGTYRLVQVEALTVPTSVDLTIAPPTDITYAGSAVLPKLTAAVSNFAANVEQNRIDGILESVPTSARLIASIAGEVVSLTYDANAVMPKATLGYRNTVPTVATLVITDVPTHLDASVDSTRLVNVNANPAITRIEGSYSTRNAPVVTFLGDHASLAIPANGIGIGIGWRISGFKGLMIDQTVANTLVSEVRIQGDQAFKVYVSTPQVLATLDVSNAPDRVRVTMTGSSFAYDATNSVNTVTLHLEVPASTLILDVTVTGLPSIFTLSWTTGTTGSVAYTATSTTTRVAGRVRRANLDANFALDGLPTSVSVTYDSTNGGVGLVANAPITLLNFDARVNGGALPTVPTSGDYIVVSKVGSAVGAVVKLSGIREISATHANGGGNYRLVASPAGQLFTAKATLENDVTLSFQIAALPTSITAEWRAGSGSFVYDGGSPLNTGITASYTKASTGAAASAVASNLPGNFRLDWTTGVAPTFTYSASGTLASLVVQAAMGPGQTAFDLNVASLPPWLQVSLAQDIATLDARTSAGGASGSAEIGTLAFKYSSTGVHLGGLPSEDHVVYVQTGSPATTTQVDFKDTGIRYIKADVRNNELHGKVMNTNPRLFKVNVDTPTATATATIANAPANVQVDLVTGALTYAASSVIPQILLNFDNKDGVANGLNVALDLQGIPTSVTMAWSPTTPSASISANAGFTSLSGSVRVNGGSAGTDTVDHLYVVRNGAQLGLDFRITNLVSASADLANGIKFGATLSQGGQFFRGQASLNSGDITGSVEVSQMPTSLSVDLRPGTRTFDYVGAGTSFIKAQYLQTSTGLQARFDVTGVPSSVHFDWMTGTSSTIRYWASATLTSVYAFYKLANSQTTFEGTVTSLPPYLELQIASDRASLDARTSQGAASGTSQIGSILFKYASNGAFLTGTPVEDHLVLVQTGSGPTTTQLEFLDTGLKYVSGSVINNEIHAKAQYAAPRVFKLNVDTATAKVTATVDAVPATVTLDLVGNSLTYGASSGITRILASFDNKDTTTGLAFDLDLQGVPTGVTGSWDRATPSLAFSTTGGSLGVLAGQVRIAGGTVGTDTVDHVIFSRSGTAMGVDFRYTGLSSLSANLANGVLLTVNSAGNQFFRIAATLDSDVTASLTVNAMPASFTVELNHPSRFVSYVGSASGTTIAASYAKASTGAQGSATLVGFPSSVRLDWTTGVAPTITYTASSRLTTLNAAYKLGNSATTFDVAATSLPPWMQLTLGTDLMTFDARTSSGGAVGSDSIGSILLRYSSTGSFLANPPAEDHFLLTQTGSPPATSQAEWKDTNLKYASVNVANNQIHATLRSATPRVMKLGFDTATDSLTATVNAVPAQVTIDYSGNSITYGASSTISQILVNFNNKDAGTSSVVLNLDIQNIPASATISWDTSAPSVTFTGGSAVGSVGGQLSIGGLTPSTMSGYHAWVKKGSTGQLAADFLVANLIRFHAAPANGGYYEVTLSPGNYAFAATLLPDSDQTITLSTNAIPSAMTLDHRPGSKSVSYSGVSAQSGASVTATYAKASTGLQSTVSVYGIPSSASLSWTTGVAPVYTYSASGRLGSIVANYKESTSGAAGECTITDLPPWMQVTYSTDLGRFDARTSSGAASGSDHVGSILCKYASNGSYLGGLPVDDHAAVKQTGSPVSTTQAELKYSGLKYVSLNTASDQVHFDIRNTAPRLFRISFETATSVFSGMVGNVPATLTIDWDGAVLKYRAASTIAQSTFWLNPTPDANPNDDPITYADIRNIPASIDITFDFTAQTASWTASSSLTSVSIYGRRIVSSRQWDLWVTLTSVPTSGSFSWSSQRPNFRTSSSALGGIDIFVTNHVTGTRWTGNHASSVYRSSNGDFDASLVISGISVLDVQRLTNGFQAEVQTTAGSVYVYADYIVGTFKAYGSVILSALPTSVTVKQENDVFVYTSNGNFNVDAYTEIGNPTGAANAPTPNWYYGLSIRDGNGCYLGTCGNGFKARLYLVGAPRGFTINAHDRTFTATSFAPPSGANSLTLDVDLDNVFSPAIKVVAVQAGIPSGTTFTMGPVGMETTSTTRNVSASYSSNMIMGRFWADITMGGNNAFFDMGSVPTSVSVNLKTANPTSSATVTVGQGVSYIGAWFKATTGASSYTGGVYLTDVPTSVTLTYGRQETVVNGQTNNAPQMSFSASSSGLDVTLWVDAVLFGNDLKAFSRLWTTNMGTSGSAGLSGSTFTMSSSPALTSIEAHVWAKYVWTPASWNSCWPSCGNWARIQSDGFFKINPLEINDLKLKFTSMSSVTIRLGVATSIEGSFGSVDFGWSSFTITPELSANVNFVVNIGCGGCYQVSVPLVSFYKKQTFTINVDFHTYKNLYGVWWEWDSPGFVCSLSADYNVVLNIKPSPNSIVRNGFALGSPSTAGNAWIVLPNPYGFAPTFAVDTAAVILSPVGGGGWTFELVCR